MFLCIVLPTPQTFAEAYINRFSILEASSYLIAGAEYTPSFDSDKADTTDVEGTKYEYCGFTGDKFAPKALTTRAEAASAIVHMLMLKQPR
ncbi:MAG: hypothetical protein WD469_05535 [Paenibacillaceae bacterium]